MTVRAKFTTTGIVHALGGYGDGGEVRKVEMFPVSANDPGSENHKFWAATPSGSAKLTLPPDYSDKVFSPGDEFYLDFQPVGDDVLKGGGGRWVIGKFKVTSINHAMGSKPETQSDGKVKWVSCRVATIHLLGEPARAQHSLPLIEGNVELGVANLAAVEMFEVDAKYWLVVEKSLV